MNNSVYTYERMNVLDYNVVDFTSYYYGSISRFLKQYSNFFEVYTLHDDEKLEEISYRFYETTDYADLILAINEDVFLWNVPYNEDINIERYEILRRVLSNNTDIAGSLESKQERIDILSRGMIEDSEKLKRNILIPKNEYISNIIGLVEKYREIYNLNKDMSEKEARDKIGLII